MPPRAVVDTVKPPLPLKSKRTEGAGVGVAGIKAVAAVVPSPSPLGARRRLKRPAVSNKRSPRETYKVTAPLITPATSYNISVTRINKEGEKATYSSGGGNLLGVET